jgi:hypothetical protein
MGRSEGYLVRPCGAIQTLVISAALSCSSLLGTSIDVASADDSVFEKPVRLEADGKVIDTGIHWGHSGPCLFDVDGDGLRDLVVGDFSGKFHVYRNVGTNNSPKFGSPSDLMAGGVPAEVRIYCCIGSSPQFFDIDGDGHPDLISGSYDPGACYLFRGLGKGRFAARETIVDKVGGVILRNAKMEVTRSFGSWPTMVDWDGDGDLDLVIGGFDGGIRVWLNEGTTHKPKFATDCFRVQAEGKPIEVPGGHAAPVIVDWDGDRRWDIVSGSESGAVVWYRNIGKPGAPYFAAAQTLVPEHLGYGYDELLDLNAEPVPGIRSQIAVADFDGDGRPDLLLGDFSCTLSPRADLTPQQRKEFLATYEQEQATIRILRTQLSDLQADFKRRYPGASFHSKAADDDWSEKYKALTASKERMESSKRLEQLDSTLRRLAAKPDGHSSDRLATDHGYVWLFRRKPLESANVRTDPGPASQPEAASETESRPTSRDPVVATASVTPRQAKPGETVTVTILVRLGSDWHINAVSGGSDTAIPTRLELKLPPGIAANGEWALPEPDIADRATGPVYRGEITFRRTLKVIEKAPDGKLELVCGLSYQACDARQCLRPTTLKLRAPLEVTSR